MDQLISRIGYPFDIGGSSALVIENASSRMSKQGDSAFATRVFLHLYTESETALGILRWRV